MRNSNWRVQHSVVAQMAGIDLATLLPDEKRKVQMLIADLLFAYKKGQSGGSEFDFAACLRGLRSHGTHNAEEFLRAFVANEPGMLLRDVIEKRGVAAAKELEGGRFTESGRINAMCHLVVSYLSNVDLKTLERDHGRSQPKLGEGHDEKLALAMRDKIYSMSMILSHDEQYKALRTLCDGSHRTDQGQKIVQNYFLSIHPAAQTDVLRKLGYVADVKQTGTPSDEAAGLRETLRPLLDVDLNRHTVSLKVYRNQEKNEAKASASPQATTAVTAEGVGEGEGEERSVTDSTGGVGKGEKKKEAGSVTASAEGEEEGEKEGA
jgi:hypothetical protein